MKFIAIIEQSGEGCDYSIGCGIDYEAIEATSLHDAWQRLIRGRWGDYDPRLGGLEDPRQSIKNDDMSPIARVRMFHVVKEHDGIYFDAWYDSACKAFEAAHSVKTERDERAEYERLKAKFDKE
jgi:hypothetical protein